MHVLLIHQAFTSSEEAGGTRHLELARHLVHAGYQVTVLASQTSYLTGDPASAERGFVVRETLEAGLSVWRCYAHQPLHRSFFHRLIAYWTFALASFVAGMTVPAVDVVWGTSPPIFQSMTALLLARMRGVPFLFEVRDLWPDFAIGLGVLRHPAVVAVSRWLEHLLYRWSDQVVINSPGFASHLRAAGVGDDRLSLVPNGVDVARFCPDSRGTDLREEWGLADRFVVLYAGAHGLANDLETLLRAAELLQDDRTIAVVFIGDGKEKPRLTGLAAEMKLSNVHFLPAQPKARMPEVLAAADVCVATLKPIPMFATTYPNKVFDYMAAGRPTVLAIDGVIRQVVEAAGAGVFVPPGNAAALAGAVRALRSEPADGFAMGEAGRAYVSKHFDRGAQGEQLRGVLRRLAVARPRMWLYGTTKRLLDAVLAGIALVILSPVMLAVALTVRLWLGGPVFFRQRRAGFRGQVFTLVKFRTMTDARDSAGNLLSDEQRLTAFGRFLRSTSLDELPELWHVVRGQMSLVGPRPLLPEYLSRYSPEQMRRHDVKPGLTGWAQVRGRNALPWPQKLALDTWYVDHASLSLDLQILIRTATAILVRRGISQPGHATAEEFTGQAS
jgi:lipopolysaccharide/colanic/teichoic acid biosynthesis glycosyltransferase/glycosyltransferase involved in cell wall biosynthesis